MVTLAIDWAKSPRIVLVDHPDVEIAQQDLIDLLREAESDLNALDDDAIIDGSGKEELDTSGTKVGITNTLQNALLGFEADTTAKSQGTATTGDPLGKTLKDIGATFQTDGVASGAVIINFDDYSVASVIEVVSQTEILHLPLANGTLDTWVIGNNYKIWNIKQGIISGGNLVGVDGNGDPVATPVYPTPFTQVILTSSSSPTLQELALIQFGSFGNRVTIDKNDGVAGQEFPAGNLENPSNNWTDALAIAASRGFHDIHIHGDYDFVATDVLDDMRIAGDGALMSIFTFAAGVSTEASTFIECDMTGVMNGTIHMDSCRLGESVALEGLKGYGKYCMLAGTLKLAGELTLMFSVSEVPGMSTPVLDFVGPNTSLSMRTYSGGAKFINMADVTNKCTIEYVAGQCVIDASCNNDATLSIRGVARLRNYSTTMIPDTESLLNRENITKTSWDTVYVDTVLGTPGTAWPIGTMETPSSNVADAKTIAIAEGIMKIHAHTDITLDRPFPNYGFESHSWAATIALNNQDVGGAVFNNVSISGQMNGAIRANECKLNGITDLQGRFYDCAFNNDVDVAAGAKAMCYSCKSVTGTLLTINLNGSGYFVDHDGMSWWLITNMTDPASVCAIMGNSGVSINNSNTAGVIFVSGGAKIDVNNGAGVTVSQGYRIAAQVFEEALADHLNPGTYGAELATKADLAASASTIYSSALGGTIVEGDPDGGAWTDTFVRDGAYWIIGEDATNGLTVEFVFELPDIDSRPGVFTLFGRYEGVPPSTHYMELWAWNYEAAAWEQLVENCVPGGNVSDAEYRHEYFERNIDRANNNEVKVRLVHNVSTYVASHALYLDYVALSCIKVVTAAQIAAAVWSQIAAGNILGLTAEETIDLTRKILNNRLELKEGSTTNWELYDDDGTLLLTYDVTDKDNAVITIPTGAPARRTMGVAP